MRLRSHIFIIAGATLLPTVIFVCLAAVAFLGWTAGLTVPAPGVNGPLWQALGIIVIGTVVLLAATLGLVGVFGRRLVSSVTALADGAKALGAGVAVRLEPLPVVELDQVRREIETAEAKRKGMEASLQQSERRLRTIIEAEPGCVKLVAPNGRLLEMNAAGLNMIQAESLEAIGDQTLLELVTVEHRKAYSELHRKVMGGGSGTLELEIIGLKGARGGLKPMRLLCAMSLARSSQ